MIHKGGDNVMVSSLSMMFCPLLGTARVAARELALCLRRERKTRGPTHRAVKG